ncbi:MAG: ester cyclase [Kofleriaceae bacterium]
MRNRIVWAAVLGLALVGCKKQEPPKQEPVATKPTEPPKAPEPKPVTPADIAAKWTECMAYMTAKDEAKFGGCMTDMTSSEIFDSGMPPSMGSKAVVERVKMMWTAFPDFKVEPQLVLVSGGNFATIDLMAGTNSGAFMGKPATNKPVGYFMTHIGQVDLANGEVKTVNALIDQSAPMMQMMGDKKAPPIAARWPAAKTVIAKDDATERENVKLWWAMNKEWNAHDVAKVTAMYADDAVLWDGGNRKIAGTKAIGDMMKGFWTAFPDAKGTPSQIWGAGDWVVVNATATGKNDGIAPAMGFAKKTGKPFTMHVIELARLEGGKVKEHWLFYNGMAMAMQLGMVPPPDAAPAKTDESTKPGEAARPAAP